MAGDWLKMRLDLADDPAVIAMAAALDISEDEVVGKLHRLWAWADRHTTDGNAPGITPKWVDRYVCTGFATAMTAVSWISFSESGVSFPNFDRHNGESAKRRGEAAIRQRLSRENRDKGVTGLQRDNIPRPFVRHVLERDGYQCVYCGTQSDAATEASKKGRMSIDHIIPATRGGSTVVCNLACCCRRCNAEKNDRTPTEWGLAPEFLQPGVAYLGESEGLVMSQKPCDKPVTREEKRREEEKPKSAPTGADLLPDVDPVVVRDFLRVRKEKRAPLTATAVEGIRREAEKANLTIESALRICCEKGWAGFSADWKGITQPSQTVDVPGGGRKRLP